MTNYDKPRQMRTIWDNVCQIATMCAKCGQMRTNADTRRQMLGYETEAFYVRVISNPKSQKSWVNLVKASSEDSPEKWAT